MQRECNAIQEANTAYQSRKEQLLDTGHLLVSLQKYSQKFARLMLHAAGSDIFVNKQSRFQTLPPDIGWV